MKHLEAHARVEAAEKGTVAGVSDLALRESQWYFAQGERVF